ncbi:MAG: DNA helicase PriA [Euryarchaeota archaeon]|nr:DNA helicase PriA [Euryarchaeota archaeon]MBV1729162.1 DNA helicase PriA [Methanobacterium sp.]MBU4547311.1 DNA helicase PriA [Euryarchaeota archaeon]MBU4607501.1 DNA helicase PriA [Euryarchaeota archaeon]MBV1754722.1 DNA helicase PriA [Methanobacterium sp.]
MKCALCGFEFDESKRLESCQACLGAGCTKIKCPNCGYETLPDPEIGKKIKNFFKRRFKSEDDK